MSTYNPRYSHLSSSGQWKKVSQYGGVQGGGEVPLGAGRPAHPPLVAVGAQEKPSVGASVHIQSVLEK